MSFSQLPSISIIYMTKRPGGYDVLFNALTKQTYQNYELICVDECAPKRADAVKEKAKALSIKLKYIGPSKPKTIPTTPFGYANAINTGLLLADGAVVCILQDYAWLPSHTLEEIAKFYANPQAQKTLLGFPEQFYIAPAGRVNMQKLSDISALSIFEPELTRSPAEEGWQAREINPTDAIGHTEPFGHWFFECFFCAAPLQVYVDLNGVDERLDTGDDCHERNIRERAYLLGYGTALHPRVIVQQIEHREWVDDPLWRRYPAYSNIARHTQMMAYIRAGLDSIKCEIANYNLANKEDVKLWRQKLASWIVEEAK